MRKIKVIEKYNYDLTGYGSIEFFDTNNFEMIPDVNRIYSYNLTSDEFLHTRGAALTAVIKVDLPNGSQCHLVLHDSGFKKLPENVQNFLMLHEVGHALKGHIDDMDAQEAKKIMIKRAFGMIQQMEVEADAYAALVIGVDEAKEAIRFLIKNTNLPFNSKIELKRRYKRLK